MNQSLCLSLSPLNKSSQDENKRLNRATTTTAEYQTAAAAGDHQHRFLGVSLSLVRVVVVVVSCSVVQAIPCSAAEKGSERY